ncbi:LOW QUALITY PROTEIN: hypothetical protein CVT26_001658 [Gymnopilus dilepis]|uniref:RRM domain-containing protein n=1 Tax=Gymnopilus dilepis TaxID=231916 RepID=A0A409WAQ6_9AGAR|nr:LOW QUALITY PROTEIN: hypothetical protein CVT26_001658 [Gymnopilus dilepis]
MEWVPDVLVDLGNVPYNVTEKQLAEIFKSVGEVIGFRIKLTISCRLVFDRDTAKPKGYGFCEFSNHETALSAVRNLNSTEVGGRPLRIDLADPDPFLEGKTTVRGQIMDGARGPGGARSNDPEAFLANAPPGIPVPKGSTALDSITQTLATMPPNQIMEVLAQMKVV